MPEKIIDQIEALSVDCERLSSLVHLLSYMIGRYKLEELNEYAQSNYLSWIESLADTTAEYAETQNRTFENVLQAILKK